MSTIRVLVVEDHQIVREGIRRVLELEPDIKVMAEAANADQALERMSVQSPDVVLVDIRMPGMDGIQLTREIKRRGFDAKVVILSTYADYVSEAIAAGASGYLSKDLQREQLVQAVRDVHRGYAPVHIRLEQDGLLGITSSRDESETLSEREQGVLKLVAEGAQAKEIAVKLCISGTTVKRTLRQAFDKLDVKNRSEAVAEAIRRQII